MTEEAARLIVRWYDLQTAEPHQLRAHECFARMLRAFYRALGTTQDWIVRGPFRLHWIDEEYCALAAVGRVGRELRTYLIEGAARDVDVRYPPEVVRKYLAGNRQSAVSTWGLWVNAYFLDAIREALFGLNLRAKPSRGAAWRGLANYERAHSAQLAFDALQWMFEHQRRDPLLGKLPLAFVTSSAYAPILTRNQLSTGSDPPAPALPSTRRVQEIKRVWRRVELLAQEGGLWSPPQNVPLIELQNRSPPSGLEGRPITPTQRLCEILVWDYGMGLAEAARQLGMKDLHEVKNALRTAERKRKRWFGGPG